MIDPKYFKCQETNRIFPIMAMIQVRERPEGNERADYLISREYRMKLEIASLFRAPTNHYLQAEYEAAQSIKRLLFREVLEGLTEIRQAMYSGESDSVMAVCNRLEEGILK